jgi:hypothetical protein
MITDYFDLQELVCPHVFNKYGQRAWSFFDQRYLITLETIRDRLGKPMFANNWDSGGSFDERGCRCIQCNIVKDYILKGELYVSGHLIFKAGDFEVQGLLGEEVRLWIAAHQNWWPYPLRLEKEVNWVHLDTMNDTDQKVYLFKK